MTEDQAERLIKALERIATALTRAHPELSAADKEKIYRDARLAAKAQAAKDARRARQGLPRADYDG